MSPELSTSPGRPERHSIGVQSNPGTTFPVLKPELKTIHRRWLRDTINDRIVPITIATKKWYNSRLNPVTVNLDVELGDPLSTIPNLDGTVADPEPRRNVPTDPKIKSEKHSRRFKERFWFTDDPGFKAFIRESWPDLLTMAVCFGIAAAIYALAKPLTPDYFLLSQSQYAYPKLNEYINTNVSAVVSFGIPFIFMGLCGIFLIGNFWDTNSALMGLGFAICTSNICQIFIKLFIGGLRPHFLTVCNPALDSVGYGFGGKYLTSDICGTRGHALNIAMMSFPSGHSAAAFAGFGYLAL